MDPMTEGILIHFYLLRRLVHDKAWRILCPTEPTVVASNDDGDIKDDDNDNKKSKKDPVNNGRNNNDNTLSSYYDEEATLQRYQLAKEILHRYASSEIPSVYRVLSEWT
jgi:hypothetical protein